MKEIDLKNIKTIAFDADDTLWRNEEIFMAAQDDFIRLLLDYHDENYIRSHLLGIQTRNLTTYGYGIKGLTLSMIETAIELTEGRILGREIHEIIRLSKSMVAEPIELLPNIENVLKSIHGKYQLMVITKGDLLDQESKLSRSGLVPYFDYIEVVSDKTPQSYSDILDRYQIDKSEFLMVGNSLKSDILPILDIGSNAIHIPYLFTWEHEQVKEDTLKEYAHISTLGEVKELLSFI
ncbi:HAD family hydrolase [Marinomonas sp. 15G1-11]|uniref:HAD family hydrolase n=1 Tax=Marinomonas phaeophyticola TaxID=3004091 RepID=A0ABT4JVC6_9GAMM|nr:HAD family hydrolase [Marinomonas sp. 15G1-11]MCZ2722206.1 HAD family hydrolase [Marinomonas sp. 15G1-11]